jgi:hypothetical protein
MVQYNISEPYINNIITGLKKKGVILPERGSVILHPVFRKLDFNKKVVVTINIENV